MSRNSHISTMNTGTPRFGNTAVLILLLSLVLFHTAPASIRIIESTPARLIFEWELKNFQTTAISEAGQTFSSISFEGQNTDFGQPGDPLIPAHALFVGVPQTGEISVSLVPHETGSMILSHPLRPRTGTLPEPAPAFSDPWISLPEYTFFRHIRAARLVIRPVMYDAVSRSLRMVTRATVTMEFPQASAGARAVSSNSPYQQSLGKLLLNYEIAQRWTPSLRALAKRNPLTYSPLRAAALSFRIGDGHEGTNQSTIRENGILRIYGRQIPASLGSALPISRVAIFASLKEPYSDTAPELQAMPIGVTEIPVVRVDLNGNGILDPDDYLLVYVTGSSDWTYQNRQFVFRINHYDNDRHYWVVVKNDGPARTAGNFSAPVGSGADTVTSFVNRIVLSRPVSLPTMVSTEAQTLQTWDGGVERIWQRLSARAPEFSHTVEFHRAIVSDSASIRVVGRPGTTSSDLLTIRINETVLCSTFCSAQTWYPVDLSKVGTTPVINLSFRNRAANRYYDLEQFELRYREPLTLQSTGGMTVFSPLTPGLYVYRLTGLPAGQTTHVLRISADESEIELIQHGGGSTLFWTDSGGIGVRYYVVSEQGLQSLPGNAAAAEALTDASPVVRDLWSPKRSNHLIVTAPIFLPAAQALAEHKQRHGAFPNRAPAVVRIDDIYRLFSGGSRNPAALRNFLSYAFQSWEGGLDYVVLMGNGHHDYRNIGTNEPMFIPTAQFDSEGSQKCVEDYFACLSPGATFNSAPDIMLGRLPCITLDEATAVVEKIRDMEDPARANFGAWRNRVLLVADDDRQGTIQDAIAHHPSTERLHRLIADQSPSVEGRKVYLFEYPRDELGEKPGATRALIDEINNGIAHVTYFGHGSDVLWADEHIFTLNHLTNLRNERRYPLMASFSCSVGRFDSPGQASLSDALVVRRSAGAIATIASTRIAYAGTNENLAASLYKSMFDSTQIRSLGQAYWEAMRTSGFSSNKAYAYLGDPSIVMVNATHRVDIGIFDSNGEPGDTLMALERITVRGTVGSRTVSDAITPDATFGTGQPAFVQIAIFNPSDSARRKDGFPAVVEYTLPGAPIFVGVTPVRSGTFEQTLLLPRNVAFGRTGARVAAYAWQDGVAAVGSKTGFVFKGTKPVSVQDTTGPQIAVRPVYNDNRRNSAAALADKLNGSLPMEIQIELFDESGINVAGVAPDEGLSVEIHGALKRTNINHLFRFVEGDFRTGSAGLNLSKGELDSGVHTLRITAQDLLGNTTVREVRLEISPEQKLTIGPVYNFPNPVGYGSSTRFFFYTSAPTYPWVNDQIRATITIFTMSGKPVRVLRNAENGIVWDCTDQRGRPLPPNVYLYRVQAEDPRNSSRKTRSEIKKLLIKPPR